MSDGEKIQRAARARAILEDPMVVEALAAIESHVYKAWRDSEPGDPGKRERAWFTLKALGLFQSAFHDFLMDGEIAEERQKQAEAEKPSTSR